MICDYLINRLPCLGCCSYAQFYFVYWHGTLVTTWLIRSNVQLFQEIFVPILCGLGCLVFDCILRLLILTLLSPFCHWVAGMSIECLYMWFCVDLFMICESR